jgi:hypothetical protein
MTRMFERFPGVRLLSIGFGSITLCSVLANDAFTQPAAWPNQPAGSGWPGMQPREWAQTQPVSANPTDFNYPQRNPGGSWHVTVCQGSLSPGDLRLPAPPGWSDPKPMNDPNGGRRPHAFWRIHTEGEEDTKVDIEGRSGGSNVITITYTERTTGNTATARINVRVIDCNKVKPPQLKGL